MLFIEKCIRLVKPGGRIAIVLPQGNLNNPTSEFLRNFIFDHCRLLGCVGLQENTFRPITPTKTSVVLLQKWRSEKEKNDDYNIFMADSEKPGKDNSGNYIYLKDKDGNYIDEKKQIIDVFDIIWDDNVKARRINGKTQNKFIKNNKPPVRSQIDIYEYYRKNINL